MTVTFFQRNGHGWGSLRNREELLSGDGHLWPGHESMGRGELGNGLEGIRYFLYKTYFAPDDGENKTKYEWTLRIYTNSKSIQLQHLGFETTKELNNMVSVNQWLKILYRKYSPLMIYSNICHLHCMFVFLKTRGRTVFILT